MDNNQNKPEIQPVLEYVNSLNLVSYLSESKLSDVKKVYSLLIKHLPTLRRHLKGNSELKVINEINETLIQINKGTESLGLYKDERDKLGNFKEQKDQLYLLIELGRKVVDAVSEIGGHLSSIEVNLYLLSPHISPQYREVYLTLRYQVNYTLKLIREILTLNPKYGKTIPSEAK
jgi:hypothetical protein